MPRIATTDRVDREQLLDALEPLVDYYRAIAGEHEDWHEYRDAMVKQGKRLLRLTIDPFVFNALDGEIRNE